MESRPDRHRTLLTLTIDPSRFGAYRVGSALQSDGRWTNLWSEPTPDQFRIAAEAMSSYWDRLVRRINARLKRRGLDALGYLRVIELHRNGWPHYHAVLEHPLWSADEVRPAVAAGWDLGRTDVQPISLHDAVGELAPYLVGKERSSHKAYQFAANALPAGFRLYSQSRGFLAPPPENDDAPDHGIALRGHFTSFVEPIRAMGGTTRLALNPPSDDLEHRPPSRFVANGDAAVVYYAQLADTPQLHAPPEWFQAEPRTSVGGTASRPEGTRARRVAADAAPSRRASARPAP